MTMAITLTESAARQIKNQLARRGKGLGLRVGVKKVGCSGFAYTFDYADEVRAGDGLIRVARRNGRGRRRQPRVPRRLAPRLRQGRAEADVQVRESQRRHHVRLRRELQPEGSNQSVVARRHRRSGFGRCRSDFNEHRTAQSRQPALQARVRHRNRVRRRAQRAQRRHDPADLGQEERAGVAARVPAEGLSALARRWRSRRGRT